MFLLLNTLKLLNLTKNCELSKYLEKIMPNYVIILSFQF